MAQLLGGRYRLVKKVLAGDTSKGVPALWRAEDAGDLFYVKLWKRKKNDLSDIRALWNREVRGLSRLQGYPGASELFLRLHDLRFDESQYYAVLEGGRRILLAEVLRDRSRTTWLLNLSEVGRRRVLWAGLLRIAEALALLHHEGTLHRALSTSAIFVAPEGQGDFRLSGFEWSLRVAGIDGAAARVTRGTELKAPELDKAGREYSTATDWFDYGLIAAEIFGAPVKNLKTRGAVRASVAALHNLREGEKALLSRLLEDDPEYRLANAEEVLQELRNIILSLSAITAGHARNLILAVRLGVDVNVSKAVEVASERKALSNDPHAQRAWIERDIRNNSRVTARVSPNPLYILRGEKLEYRVVPWVIRQSSTWEIGFCDAVETVPRVMPDEQYFALQDRKLEVISLSDAWRSQQRLRDKSAPWDRVFPFPEKRDRLEPHLRDVHDFFRITQQLDTVITASQICLVQIVSVDRSEDATTVTVTPRDDAERADLALHLGLPPPAEQLRDWFDLGVEPVGTDDEEDPKRDIYQLLDRKTIDSEGGDIKWRFIGAAAHQQGFRYRFRCDGNVPERTRIAYLARNHGGTIAQIKRRHKAIDELRYHEGLLRLLADPKSSSRKNEDEVPGPRTAIPLDESKKEALSRLWQTQPSFAIQGPPGTGKTTLIKAFVDRLNASDPSAQILIAAHSHHTVDDVRSKLGELFTHVLPARRPILLRLGSREPTEHDIHPVTMRILHGLQQGSMQSRMPQYLRERLGRILTSESSQSDLADVDRRTMQLLVQDAANVTLSTLNSPELADLSDRNRRFDWVIVEEAGKAHGFDMAIALSESHRLVLIGDHFQLPPFNSKMFKKLLAEPLRVRKAIQAGFKFAPNLLDVSIVEDSESREPFEIRCQLWSKMVDLFGRLFEESIGEDGDVPGPAVTLTDQHRMHPHIAEVVGRIFYRDDASGTIIKTPEEAKARFEKASPFIIKPGSWLPEQRIVWCDVSWKQRKEHAEGESDGVFAAPEEVRAVVRVLDELTPKGTAPCGIQVLSPYNDQLDRIRGAILKARSRGHLGPMFQAPFDLTVAKRLGATVDEFQGSEADVVIVSLVRNNPFVPWKSLGFLKEENRMNVLLSRARHKLVIVGSWDFFASRCNEHTSPDEDYAYIGRMMEQFRIAEEEGWLKRQPVPQ